MTIKKLLVFTISTFLVANVLMAEVVNTIVAVVGASPVTLHDFRKRKVFLTAQSASQRKKVSDKEVYNDFLEEHVMYSKLEDLDYEIEERDIENRIKAIANQYNVTIDEFIKQVEGSGVAFDEYKSVIKKQIAMESLYSTVVSPPEINDDEANKYYESLSTKEKMNFEGDTVVRLSWIFFKAKTFTEKGQKKEIAGRVRYSATRGGDFGVLAKTHSDDAGTKEYGGDLGYNLMADVGVRALPAHITYGLNLVKNGAKVGAVSKVMETVGSGFWLVKVTGIEKDKDSIKSRVKSWLYEKKSKEAFVQWLKEEKEKVAVTIYPAIK